MIGYRLTADSARMSKADDVKTQPELAAFYFSLFSFLFLFIFSIRSFSSIL